MGHEKARMDFLRPYQCSTELWGQNGDREEAGMEKYPRQFGFLLSHNTVRDRSAEERPETTAS
jgi:hypothetical protein